MATPTVVAWFSHWAAARAAEVAGNRQAACDYYAKLQTLTADRDTERPELIHAKAFLIL